MWLGIEKKYKFKHEVLVVPQDCPHEVLLGNDLTIFDELYKLAQVHGVSDCQVKVVTRRAAKKQREELLLDRVLDVRDSAQPVECPLANKPLPICGGPEDNDREAVLDEVDVQDEREVSVMKEDAQGGERVEVVGQGNVEAEKLEEGVRLDTLAQVDNEQGADIPIPAMVGSNEDREQLIKEQSTDESLKDIRQWAAKGERGYSYANGLLVHNLITPSEQVHTRIVVPSIRRTELLKFAHSSILGGHFSHSKPTEGLLGLVRL